MIQICTKTRTQAHTPASVRGACVSWFEVGNIRGRRFESPGCKFCRDFFGFGAKNHFFWTKIPYVAILYCLGWLVGWLWLVTTLKPVSPQIRATKRTFSFENRLRKPYLFSKEACKTSQKLSEKGCFRLEFMVFFCVFFLSSWLIFSAKNQRDATFLTLKKNYLTLGVKALIQYLTCGNNVNIHFFMWCDVQRFPSFFLLSRLLCCQRGHPLDWIEYMKLILINIFSDTVLRRWCSIDSTK